MARAEEIAENFRRIRSELPDDVRIVVAAKMRSADELRAVIEAGARALGENYVAEADEARAALGEELAGRVEWHMIGHLQRNKINRVLPVFDVLQSLDSLRLARAVSKRVDGPPMPCLIEVNIGGEESKTGLDPGKVREVLRSAAELPGLRLKGLMGMEPYCEDPEDARPYFARMRRLFEELRAELPDAADFDTLSMGMSHSYRVAAEEGATMVRLGTVIFGPRA